MLRIQLLGVVSGSSVRFSRSVVQEISRKLCTPCDRDVVELNLQVIVASTPCTPSLDANFILCPSSIITSSLFKIGSLPCRAAFLLWAGSRSPYSRPVFSAHFSMWHVAKPWFKAATLNTAIRATAREAWE